jgi:predicted aldo/keto reductase-like oxidoreductase
MEYRPLGRTGVRVSKLCLGTMMFGAWGDTDHDDAIRIIHRALDAGINFLDTYAHLASGCARQTSRSAATRLPRRTIRGASLCPRAVTRCTCFGLPVIAPP